MHCPRCGHQQISDDIKFCAKCGFPLSLIAEVLDHGGTLPQLASLDQKKKFLTRKNGVIFGVFWIMTFLLILTPIWSIIGVEEMAGASAVLGIFGGLMIMIASLVFLDKQPKRKFDQFPGQSAPANFYGYTERNALPPQRMQPASQYAPPEGAWRSPETGELAVPGSVTDGTTKLLRKEEE